MLLGTHVTTFVGGIREMGAVLENIRAVFKLVDRYVDGTSNTLSMKHTINERNMVNALPRLRTKA